jgi:hypothetical protein
MNIRHLVWSKDRACQLDLLLRSAERFMPFIDETVVIYKASNEFYADGYRRLIEKYYSCEWMTICEEFDFHWQILHFIKTAQDRVLGNSDDNVFIRNVPINLPNVANLSLRLHPGVTYCQPAQLEIKSPGWVIQPEDYMGWDYTLCDPRGCWGYPHPCDSHIYKHDVWYDQIKTGSWSNPASLEIWMNTHRIKFQVMYCFPKACLISVSNNSTGQAQASNQNGQVSLEDLNRLWLSGKQIELAPFENLEHNACHIIKPYTFEDR